MFAREPCQSGARACQGDSRACQAWLSCPRRRLSQKVSTGRSIVPMVSLRLLNVTASDLRPRTGGGGSKRTRRRPVAVATADPPVPHHLLLLLFPLLLLLLLFLSSSSSCSGHRSFRRVRCPPPFHPQRSPERQPSGGRSGLALRNLTTLYSYRSSSSSPSVRTSSPTLRASSRVLCQRGGAPRGRARFSPSAARHGDARGTAMATESRDGGHASAFGQTRKKR